MEISTETLFERLKNQLNENVNKLLSSYENGDNINLAKLKENGEQIKQLIKLQTEMANFSAELSNKVKSIRTQHYEELNIVRGAIDELQDSATKPASASTGWLAAVKSRKNAETKKNNDVKQMSVIATVAAAPNRYMPPMSAIVSSAAISLSKIPIIDGFSINAKKIPDFSCVEENGVLYYIENHNHFAFKIGGLLLHGNIGKIFTNAREPTKIKSCKYKNQCVKPSCEYYHDPIINAESKDYRNFISTSFVYSAPTSVYRGKNKSSRFGSRENLGNDISELTDEDVDRFYDQTMHFVLCSIILRHFYKPSSCD